MFKSFPIDSKCIARSAVWIEFHIWDGRHWLKEKAILKIESMSGLYRDIYIEESTPLEAETMRPEGPGKGFPLGNQVQKRGLEIFGG